MTAQIIRGNALALPLADDTVDLIVTSPPYFGLRSYQDDGQHYDGQIGAEPTPAEFVDALIAATKEMVRVLKPSGSIWVNLGDRYSSGNSGQSGMAKLGEQYRGGGHADVAAKQRTSSVAGMRPKSLIGVPWRYAIRCIDDLGLILRAEVIWAKPNGLPESVTDRVRRSHETWFHFTKEPRYYSSIDAIREPHSAPERPRGESAGLRSGAPYDSMPAHTSSSTHNPLGKLPGSVWTIPTQPLRVPPELGVDHFAAFPMEWPRRIIQGWSPTGVCTGCGEGRRPVAEVTQVARRPIGEQQMHSSYDARADRGTKSNIGHVISSRTITGEVCGCPDTTAPTTRAVVLDPFGGTGTTALVADVLDRDGVSVDMSADYCRLAEWRVTDPKQRARALRGNQPAKTTTPPTPTVAEQLIGAAQPYLFD